MSARRGASAVTALAAVVVLAAVASIGLGARSGELAFERRGLSRLCARWAAEAGIAEARGMLAAGQKPAAFYGSVRPATGHARAAFTVRGAVEGGGFVARTVGSCTASGDGRATRVAITVRWVVREGRWTIASWEEGPEQSALQAP